MKSCTELLVVLSCTELFTHEIDKKFLLTINKDHKEINFFVERHHIIIL